MIEFAFEKLLLSMFPSIIFYFHLCHHAICYVHINLPYYLAGIVSFPTLFAFFLPVPFQNILLIKTKHAQIFLWKSTHNFSIIDDINRVLKELH